MQDYPAFMKNPLNAIAAHQKSQGVEGYIFDGADGSQMAIFQCSRSGISNEHTHEFDEYFVVIQGEYILGIMGQKIRMTAGQEYFIPKGVPHDGSFTADTRTIHAFNGNRAERESHGSR
jgi:quercetin dioxygenase-like cupin family protein